MSSQTMTREEWLIAAAADLAPEVGAPPFYVSTGFPKGRSGKHGKRIGECWDGRLSQDGRPHIFLSPVLAEPVQVLATLAHELIHAATPGAGHRRPFIEKARAIGLVGPWTATTPGDALAGRLAALAGRIGTYPHAPLAEITKKKQTTRMRLWECSCPVKIRAASDDLHITCDDCAEPFVMKTPGGAQEDESDPV